MPFSAVPKTLVVYSSPDSLGRLRLDKEHKTIDGVLARYSFPEKIIRRIHAATLLDVSVELHEQEYELVLFSCHGDDRGLYLEGAYGHVEVPWNLLTKTLAAGAPYLSLIVLNACSSLQAQQTLHAAAPFLILMDGDTDDDAAITFNHHFLGEFYRSTAVQHAFNRAVAALEQMGLGNKAKPILSRREPSGKYVVQAQFEQRDDSIFIDLNEARDSIARLPVSPFEFISLLTRKIRIHSWIFKVERERAVLPIGQFFGVFSWRNANDIVVCHQVLQLKPDVDVADCMGWTRLMVIYNDLCSERYRIIDPRTDHSERVLFRAIESMEKCYTYVLQGPDVSAAALRLAPVQYAVTVAAVRIECDIAREKLETADLSRAIAGLETAISSIHDLVEKLTECVTITESSAKQAGI